jgi:hypothetical protein
MFMPKRGFSGEESKPHVIGAGICLLIEKLILKNMIAIEK